MNKQKDKCMNVYINSIVQVGDKKPGVLKSVHLLMSKILACCLKSGFSCRGEPPVLPEDLFVQKYVHYRYDIKNIDNAILIYVGVVSAEGIRVMIQVK